MSAFDYLSVLFSVILGLAVTEILQGFRALVLARQRVVPFVPALIWGGLMILIVAQVWWGMFGMRSFREWNFAMYGAVVLQSTLMYLAAGVVLPEPPEHGPIDMRAVYFANCRWFFGLMTATIAATFVKDYVTIGHISSSWNAYFLELYFVLSLIATITKSRWYHWFLAPFSIVVIGTYTALLSFRL